MTESVERPEMSDPDQGTVHRDPYHDDSAYDGVIAEALSVIDQALGQMVSRELVSSGEVADLLLDLRTALTATPSRV